MKNILLLILATIILTGCTQPGASGETSTLTEDEPPETTSQPPATGGTNDITQCLRRCYTVKECELMCYVDYANLNQDVTLCEQVRELSDEVSSGIVGRNDYYARCVTGAASAAHDPTWCNKLDYSAELKEICINTAQ